MPKFFDKIRNYELEELLASKTRWLHYETLNKAIKPYIKYAPPQQVSRVTDCLRRLGYALIVKDKMDGIPVSAVVLKKYKPIDYLYGWPIEDYSFATFDDLLNFEFPVLDVIDPLESAIDFDSRLKQKKCISNSPVVYFKPSLRTIVGETYSQQIILASYELLEDENTEILETDSPLKKYRKLDESSMQ